MNLPIKSRRSLCLLRSKTRAGRSNGKIAVRHQGGGHKRRYRLIDFKQQKFDIPGRIVAIEKDPNRSALIALISYNDGDKRYMLATRRNEGGRKDFVVFQCADQGRQQNGS